MPIEITQVDAFTDRPFAGNPAAVCVLDAPRPEAWMQNVAAEMNLSETAFLHPESDGYRLRWFTPAVEVALCGHATLASAHVLWELGLLDPMQQARFHTRSGLLTAERDGAWITLDFPAAPPRPAELPEALRHALGVPTGYVGRNDADFLIELESAAAVRSLVPGPLAIPGVRGVIVTAPADQPGFDFVSRFFAPAVGVPEDPVTGSAHCCLAPFWAERLGRTSMTGFQASARGGVVRVRTAGDRVILQGQAITVLRGQFLPD